MLYFEVAKRKKAADFRPLHSLVCVRVCVLALPSVLAKLREKQTGSCSYEARARGKEARTGGLRAEM